MPAELALHRVGNLPRRHLEGGGGEFRHHALLGEPAEIAALGARILRDFLGDLGKILAGLQALENGLRVLFLLDEDVAGAHFLLRLLVRLGFFVGFLDGFVGRGRLGDAAEFGLHQHLLAQEFEALLEFGAVAQLVGGGLPGDQLGVDQIVHEIGVAGLALNLGRQAGRDLVERHRHVFVGDFDAVDLGEHLGEGGGGGKAEGGCQSERADGAARGEGTRHAESS